MSSPPATRSANSKTSPAPRTPKLGSRGQSRRKLGPQTEDTSGISDRLFHDTLKAKGYGDLAQRLNHVKTKSRKDKLGAITVRKFSGPDNNAAYRTAKEFEKRAGGTGDIAEKLEALGDTLPRPMRDLALALRGAPKVGLAKVLANEQASLIQAMKWYAKGAVELAQLDAAIEMHRNLPPVVKDIARHALDQVGVCQQCLGTGTQRQKSTDSKETLECRLCQGTGTTLISSPHKEWAAKAILNATGVEKQKGGPDINVAVGINVAGGKGYSERVIDMADRLLHGQEEGDDKAGDVVEAEVVAEKA